MKETIQLITPIRINGTDVANLTYDMDEITLNQFTLAEARTAKAMGAGGGVSSAFIEVDAVFHLYLCLMGVIAVNPEYAIEDLERIKGRDVITLSRIGRNFTNRGLEGPSTENLSEESSEPTAACTTPPKENSEPDE